MAANAKSPAELKSEGEELKALFAKVKKKQHNCAVLMAKDGIVVEVHIKKSPDILLKAGKKNGGMPKGAWGTMTMDGQVIRIDPINEKIPGNLTKLAKKFFSARGLKYRLEILEPEDANAGNEEAAPAAEDTSQSTASEAPEAPAEAAPEDARGTDEATDSAPSSGATVEEKDPKAELEARLGEMQKEIDVLQDDPENVMFSALQDTLAGYKRWVEDEDYERGSNMLDSLKGVLEDYAGILAQKTPLQERKAAMAKGVERVKQGDNTEAAEQIARTLREVDYALANNEWIGASEGLDKVEELIDAHGGAAEEPAETEEEEVKAEATSGKSYAEAETDSKAEPSEAAEASAPQTEDLKNRFNALMPTIRQAAASDDAPLKKKIAMLIKGFNAELKKGASPKGIQILNALDTLLGKVERTEATPAESTTTDSEAAEVKAQKKSGFMSKLLNMKSELSGMMSELEG